MQNPAGDDGALEMKVAPLGVVSWIRNMAAWLFGIPAFFWGFVFTVIILLLAPFGWHRRFAGWCAGLLMETLVIILGVKLEVIGLEHVDEKRHYVIAANHRSWVDALAVITALKPKKIAPVFIIKRGLLFFPVFGIYMWLSGYVPVTRGGRREKNQRALEKAARHINQGITVLVFPEGTRSPTHSMLPFKRGGFELAIASKTPVLPMAISGAGQLMPRSTPWVRAGRVRVEILPPIAPTDDDTSDVLAKRTRQAIASRYRLDVDAPPLEELPELRERALAATR